MSYGNPNIADHLPAGTVVAGRYEIQEVVGEGGFATVYRARQAEIQRDVALKLLNPAADRRTQEAFQERFRREARTAARIDHPNVVTIYDFGIAEELGQPFMAMELLQGHDLEDELQNNGPMSAERALPLFVEVLEALGDAHKLGIIHKDLKPSNLFLTQPGSRRETLKILDFGIARLADVQAGKGKLTGTGQILGTPQYLAPEYIQHQTATPALDVYQMALILVEALTGAPVVDYDNPYQCLMVHGSGKLEVPQSLVTGPLGPVLLQALELDHEARYTDASLFQAALAGIEVAHIGVIPAGEIKHRLSEVSGSMRSNADLGHADTGLFSQRNSGALDQQGERVLADGSLAMAATAATVAPSGSHTPPAPVRGPVSADLDAPPRNRMKIGALVAVAAFLLLAVVAGGAIAIWLGMDYGLAAGDGEAPAVAGTSEAKVETPKAADPPAAVPDKVAPKPVPVEVAVTAPPGVEIHRDGKLIGTGTATVTFDSDKAAPVDLAFKGEDWTPKTLSVGPDKKSVAVELTPKPEPAAAANRPKRVKRPKRTTLPKKTSAKPVNVKAPVKADPPPKKKKAKKMGFVE